MELTHGKVCEELLMDLICYEIFCGRLSPEMEYLLEMHIERCPSCRHRMRAFQALVQGPKLVRNFG